MNYGERTRIKQWEITDIHTSAGRNCPVCGKPFVTLDEETGEATSIIIVSPDEIEFLEKQRFEVYDA